MTAIARVVSRPHDRATIAENLDKLPEPVREQKISEVVKGNQDTLAALANKPPVPKKKPPSTEDRWRDFFDDTDSRLTLLTGHNGVEGALREWGYEEKEWFLNRLRELMATLDDVESTALRSFDYDERAEGATSETVVH